MLLEWIVHEKEKGKVTGYRDCAGAIPLTVQLPLPVSPAGGLGGWLKGGGVTSSAHSWKRLSPTRDPTAGMYWTQLSTWVPAAETLVKPARQFEKNCPPARATSMRAANRRRSVERLVSSTRMAVWNGRMPERGRQLKEASSVSTLSPARVKLADDSAVVLPEAVVMTTRIRQVGDGTEALTNLMAADVMGSFNFFKRFQVGLVVP